MRKFLPLFLALVAAPALATVPANVSSSGPYTCTGSATAFSVGFPFQANADLAVTKKSTATGVVTTLAIGTDYTVIGAGGLSGTVTLVSASRCPSGYTLTIKRALSVTQPSSFPLGVPYSPKAHEKALDRLAMVAQQLDRTHAEDLASAATQRTADLAAQSTRDATQDSKEGADLADVRAQLASAALGGGVNIADSSTVLATGSTTTRSLAARAGDVVTVDDFGAIGNATWTGPSSAAWSGTDDRAAIQAAINAVKPSYSHMDSYGAKQDKPSKIIIPNRNFGISAPLVLYSGQTLECEGAGSKIVALSSFSGPAIIIGGVANPGTESVLQNVRIVGCYFEAEQTDVWAIDFTNIPNVLQVHLEHLRLWTKQGIKLGDLPSTRPVFRNVTNGQALAVPFSNGTTVKVYADGNVYANQVVAGGQITAPANAHALTTYVSASYTQHSTIRDVLSLGAIDHLLVLSGNQNEVQLLDKEGATADSDVTHTDPYVWVRYNNDGSRSSGNRFVQVTLEAATSTYKELMRLEGATATNLQNCWYEVAASNGYELVLDDSPSAFFLHEQPARAYATGARKIKLINGSTATFVGLTDAAQEWVDLNLALEVDATSHANIGRKVSRYARGMTRKTRLATEAFDSDLATDLLTDVKTGILPVNYPRPTPGSTNLFRNGSFEAGKAGWSLDPGVTVAVEPSELVPARVGDVAPKMLHLSGFPYSVQLYQSFSITAEQAGTPIAVSMWVKLTGGTNPFSGGDSLASAGGGTQLRVWTNGCGITNDAEARIVQNDLGWVLLTRTVVPQVASAPCTLDLGLYVGSPDSPSTAQVYVDEATATVGVENRPQAARFGSINVGGCEESTASAIPTGGPWPYCSVVRNTAPAAGTAAGWVCTNAAGCSVSGDWKALAPVGAARAAAQVDSAAADVATLKTDFNALLAKLRAAGLMAP